MVDTQTSIQNYRKRNLFASLFFFHAMNAKLGKRSLQEYNENIIESLNLLRFQRTQLHSAKAGIQVQFHAAAVKICRGRLDVFQIAVCPDTQPLGDRHVRRLRIGAVIDGAGCRFQLLQHLFLCFPGDGVLDLLAGSGVKTR